MKHMSDCGLVSVLLPAFWNANSHETRAIPNRCSQLSMRNM